MAPAVCRALAEFYQRNGVVRRPNSARRKKEKQRYHKGYEVRLVAFSEDELATIRDLLRQAGFAKLGRPFRKIHRLIQPLYGKAAVAQFLALVGDDQAPDRSRPTTRPSRGPRRPKDGGT
jgi:hypothetical protein